MTPVSSALRQDPGIGRSSISLVAEGGAIVVRLAGIVPGLGLMDSSTDHSASASGFSLIGLLLARGTRELPPPRA